MTRSLDPKCPDFGRKGISAEVGNLLCRCCFPVSSCVVLVSVFHCIVLFSFSPLSLLLLKFDLYCDSAMIYCRVFLLVRCMLLQIPNLYAEEISKLRRDSSWKDAKPAFTCGLWHSRCMKEYFTMTAHWIEIRGGELSPQWVLRQRVLGAFPVQDASIDHQGECQNMLNI